MSLVRWSPSSDVYIYSSTRGGRGVAICCDCSLGDADEAVISTLDDLRAHLAAHVDAGDDVPAWVIESVGEWWQRDLAEEPAAQNGGA